MPTIALSPIPPIPSPGDKDFETKIGKVLSHMPTLATELKTIADATVDAATIVDVDGNATVAATAASQASTAAGNAVTAASAAAAHANTAKTEATKAGRSKSDAALAASQAGTNAVAAIGAAERAEDAVLAAEAIAATKAEEVATQAAANAATQAVSGVIAQAQASAEAAATSAADANTAKNAAQAAATTAGQSVAAIATHAQTAQTASTAASNHAHNAGLRAAESLASAQQATSAGQAATAGAAQVLEILDNLNTGPVVSVNGKYGAVNLVKADLGLGNVDNTSDANKPLSTAAQTALNGKEASGTAATAMSAHTGAADPHSQYLPKAGGTMSGSISFAPAQTWPTFNQSTTGNAGTATKLATARTLTLGGTGKAFDGTANVAWTLAEMGAQPTLVSGTNIKTVSGQSILGTGDIVAGLSNFTESINTEVPNDTTNAIALTTSGTATNIDFCMVAKGTGALLAQVPDGAATGGNKRGQNSTDFQRTRSAATQVASGNYSVIGGGYGNTASGGSSVIGGGYGNTASGGSSVIGGGFGNTASGGSSVIGGGTGNTASGYGSTIPGGCYATANGISGLLAYGFYGAVLGQNQMAFWGGRLNTTNATPTRITADSTAASASNQLTLRSNSAFRVRGTVVARNTSTNDCKEWTFEALIKRGASAAATAIVGTPSITSTFADTNAASWAIAVTADTTNGALAITATGAASTSIRWTAVVHSIEVA